MHSGLKIDTSLVASAAGPSSAKSHSRSTTPAPATGRKSSHRIRSDSTSSFDIVSPTSSSTNASTSSLPLQSPHPSPSPSELVHDDTVRLAPGAEYVLAMHDYAPQPQTTSCLSFRAGQVIHVFNRDQSGWWDGELEGRRGWFPSNYVNPQPTEEELEIARQGQDPNSRLHTRRPSITEALGPDIDSYCPPLMVPLLHGLSLLQNAVRSNRITHFRPSAGCIISCVRSILNETGCLPKDAPTLQRLPVLAQERKRVLSFLAALVEQSKKASGDLDDEETREMEIELLLRQAGQVFAYVRRFLAVAVQCGIELPDKRTSFGSMAGSTDTEGQPSASRSSSYETLPLNHSRNSSINAPLMTHSQDAPVPREIIATSGSALRAQSVGNLHEQRPMSSHDEDLDASLPLLPNRPQFDRGPSTFKQQQYTPRHRQNMLSTSSTSSSSSFSSLESASPPVQPIFPSGPCSAIRLLEALRSTHDTYLSTIAAFIGHAHSYSRSSHASSTGHMYDLVREIVENVCRLLTVVEAVLGHPEIPPSKLGTLRLAKDALYGVTSTLAESVRVLTEPLPEGTTEEEEKQMLLRSATAALKAGADCVGAVKVCLALNRGRWEHPFIVQAGGSEQEQVYYPDEPSHVGELSPTIIPGPSIAAVRGYFGAATLDDEDLTIQAQTSSPVRVPPSMSAKMKARNNSSGSDHSILSQISSRLSDDTAATTPEEIKALPPLNMPDFNTVIEPDLPSPTSLARTDDDGTTWEGSLRSHGHGHGHGRSVDDKRWHGQLPSVPLEVIPEASPDGVLAILQRDYAEDDVAYNSDGHLVGASLDALVERMTPHDALVDPAFSAVFFMTFRLFATSVELVDRIIARWQLAPQPGLTPEAEQLWYTKKGFPMRVRVSNFVKTWVELHWRPAVDDSAAPALTAFVHDGLAGVFPGPAQRILELLERRRQQPTEPGSGAAAAISAKGQRAQRDPPLALNPLLSATTPSSPSEIPRPTMTKALLALLRARNFSAIVITDFDALELARQLTVMECKLYGAITAEEVLDSGVEGTRPPANVRAVSTLSTMITGWVAESILSEHDIKKRTTLVKFFIKVADVSRPLPHV
ncbi:hypothetical protein HGRIS_006292 [Hohenbuehelia grisea]|uniref:SH3 domain-containing protein n=1 Tax=Hohenbuehelia grisea TaxID=104357 RepID=A0ABR3JZW4_9AGAR